MLYFSEQFLDGARRHLAAKAQEMVENSHRDNTKHTYSAAQRRYKNFCEKYSIDNINEDALLMYVAYLKEQGLKVSSIKVYLAAVRSYYVEKGYGNILDGYLRLKQAIKALEINAEPPKVKLPVTLELLDRIRSVVTQDYEGNLFLAAICLGFYGCLRCSEFTVNTEFSSAKHLCRDDIVFLNVDGISVVRAHIKRSKTDHYNKGFFVYLPCMCPHACAHCSMHNYLAVAEMASQPGTPLFRHENMQILTKGVFVKQMHTCISRLGIPVQHYSGHSLRTGLATTAAAAGLSDWEIKMLGRWSSDAYRRYIRIAPTYMVSLTRKIY